MEDSAPFVWSLVALVWGGYVARAAYLRGKRAGREAERRARPTEPPPAAEPAAPPARPELRDGMTVDEAALAMGLTVDKFIMKIGGKR